MWTEDGSPLKRALSTSRVNGFKFCFPASTLLGSTGAELAQPAFPPLQRLDAELLDCMPSARSRSSRIADSIHLYLLCKYSKCSDVCIITVYKLTLLCLLFILIWFLANDLFKFTFTALHKMISVLTQLFVVYVTLSSVRSHLEHSRDFDPRHYQSPDTALTLTGGRIQGYSSRIRNKIIHKFKVIIFCLCKFIVLILGTSIFGTSRRRIQIPGSRIQN